MTLRITLPLALAIAVLATPSAAEPFGAPTQAADQPETINGIAIRKGVERLSYISPRYFGIRAAFDACVKQSQGAMPKQQDCAETELTYQEGRLNRAYKALLADLDDLDRRAAVEAQRAWLAFRDKDCAARAGRFGPDAGPSTESTCRMESTAYRAQQIEDWYGSAKSQPSH
jgi:uncharacterized protein YecT (DUF1311 family)